MITFEIRIKRQRIKNIKKEVMIVESLMREMYRKHLWKMKWTEEVCKAQEKALTYSREAS